MKIWKPVCTELGRVLPVSYQTSFPSSWIFIKSAFYRDTEPGHKAGLGQRPRPLTREREVNQGPKTVGRSPDQHRNYRLSSRHIFSSFHSRDSTLGATQLLFFIRTLLCWPENKVKRTGGCMSREMKQEEGAYSSHNPNDIRPDLIQLEMGRGQRADRRPGAGARCQLGKKRWVIAAQILFMILTALRPAPRIRHGQRIIWNYPHYATLGDVKTNTPHPWWHDLSVKKHRGSNNKQKPMRWKNQIEFRLVSSQWPTVPRARAQ